MGKYRHILRVAQVGWEGSQAAASYDEADAGIMVPWIEIDGHRLTSDVISGVEITMDHTFTVPKVTFIALVEIVYVDQQGKPLPLRRRIRAKRTAKKVAKRSAPVRRNAAGGIAQTKRR